MEIIIPIIGLVIAYFALLRGAYIFMLGAKSLGDALGMSVSMARFLTGLGTLLPGFTIALTAAFMGSGGIVIPYVIGSTVASVFLILGFTALFFGTIHFQSGSERTGIPFFITSTILMVFTVFDGSVSSFEALILLGASIVYVFHFQDGRENTVTMIRPPIKIQSVGYIIGGIAALVIGGSISIDMIERLGSVFNTSVEFLSITLLAWGTTLPGLIRGLREVRRSNRTLALESIFGTIVFNGLCVLGIAGMLTTLNTDMNFLKNGLPFFVAASLMLIVFSQVMRIQRFEGMMLLILFGFFLAKLTPFL